MKEIIIETLVDNIKLFPFLILAFLIIELIEHKFNSKKIIKNSGKLGPLVGSLCGIVPQCGFGVLATNLYVTRIITLGTLIAVYLSTSDEMIPIMISQNVDISLIIKIILIKVSVGIACGFVIDLVYRKKECKQKIKDFCEVENCDCKHGIIKSSLKHSFNIFFFILIFSFVLNIYLYFIGEDTLGKIFLKGTIFGPFVSSLIGLIPNCCASVAITELYLNGALSFGSLIGGLLSGSGVSLAVLFKTNKNLKENINILVILYLIGAIIGFIIDLIGLIL